jgi:hypothetical protein
MNTRADRLTRRLARLGIEIQLVGNLPWIYLDSVAGRPVRERFRARHGFTAFFLRVRDGEIVWSDRRRVFVKIREML